MKLRYYYIRNKKSLIVILFSALLCSLFDVLFPLIISNTTDRVVGENDMRMGEILLLFAGLLTMVIIQFIGEYLRSYLEELLSLRICSKIREDLMLHIESLPFSFFDKEKTGDLLHYFTNDIMLLEIFYGNLTSTLFIPLIQFIGGSIILRSIDFRLLIIVLLSLPFMTIFSIKVNFMTSDSLDERLKKDKEAVGNIEEVLSGIRMIKALSNTHYVRESIHKWEEDRVPSHRKYYRCNAILGSGCKSFYMLLQVIILVAGIILLRNGELKASDFIISVFYVNIFVTSILNIISFLDKYRDARICLKNINTIMMIDPDIKDVEQPVQMDEMKGEIVFEEVSFQYNDRKEILNNFSLHINIGEYIAVVGSSGVGKSTIANLIPRFYDVTKGCVRIDGIDVRLIGLESLRRHIGVVQQDTFLFSGSVLENIRFGRLDATNEEVYEAAKKANIHEFIIELPNGYLTEVGQRGVRLSGGQKQRLALARIFLKNPSVLIFDEATSALDNESEKKVQKAMERLAKGRTTIVIAHRLSTIQSADRILVMTKEGIAEEGTHEELLNLHGEYERLYNSQFEK